MNLIFESNLEKRTNEDSVIVAQLTIGEKQGVWIVLWSESALATPLIWIESNDWYNMLIAFKAGLREKIADGFLPILN